MSTVHLVRILATGFSGAPVAAGSEARRQNVTLS
jgi:hypothetical protein